MKLNAQEFQELFQKSGGKTTAKGRPIIDLDVLYNDKSEGPKPNRRVINATPVYDGHGERVADSRWEYYCKGVMEDAGLEFKFKRKFELLPTTRQKDMRTLKKRTWTPDFVFEQHKLVVDAKGHITEMARIKIQLFLFVYPEWRVVLLQNKNQLYNLIKNLKEKEHESRQDFH